MLAETGSEGSGADDMADDATERAEGDEEGALALIPADLDDELRGVPAADPHNLLLQVRLAADAPEGRWNPGFVAASEHYLDKKVHIGSVSAEAAQLGLDRKEVRRCRLLCAGLTRTLEREFWSSIEHRILGMDAERVEFLCYVEIFTYDGVDLTMKTMQSAGLGADFAVPEGDDGDDPATIKAELQDFLGRQNLDLEKGPAKLLNSLHSVAVLISLDGRPMILQMEASTPLQCVDRNTGETIRQAMAEIRLGGEELRDRCSRRVRLVTTDKAGYNLRAERHFLRSDDTGLLHFICDVHCMANIHQRVYGLCDGTVSGMQKVALSLQTGGTMCVWRKALRRVLVRQLVLVREEPSADAKAYRDMILDTFCGTDIELASLRAVLCKCASGDWRQPGIFQYLAAPGERRVDVLKMLLKHFVPAIAAHAPATFPKHRWTGAKKSIRDQGLLAGMHNLLHSTYREFLSLIESRGDRAPADPVVDGAQAPAGQMPDGPEGPPVTAEAKRAYRGAAISWIEGAPVARDLVMIATVLGPMTHQMEKLIESSSALSTTMQESARLSMADVGIREAMCQSDWPLMQAAEMVLNNQSMDSIEGLHDVDNYSAWPLMWRSVESQALLFKMLSREAACIKEMLIVKHRSFPYKLFPLLRGAGAEVAIRASCEPSLDGYSTGFLAKHGADLSAPAALSELALVVCNTRVSTVVLESLNATVRRRLHVANTQVQMSSLENVSAEFLLGKLRRRMWDSQYPPGHKKSWMKEKPAPAPLIPQKRRGGGSAFRAFLHQEGGSCADPEKAKRYRELSAADMQALRESGDRATSAHKWGVRAFGPARQSIAVSLVEWRRSVILVMVVMCVCGWW